MSFSFHQNQDYIPAHCLIGPCGLHRLYNLSSLLLRVGDNNTLQNCRVGSMRVHKASTCA